MATDLLLVPREMLKRLERDAERYERLKRIHRVGFSGRYLLFRHSAADLSSEEFDQALDALAETLAKPDRRQDAERYRKLKANFMLGLPVFDPSLMRRDFDEAVDALPEPKESNE